MTGSSDLALEELRVLLLRYLEGSLPEDEEQDVADLLRTSQQARWELMALKNIVSTLKTDKTLFCPDPSDVAEFVEHGNDPSGRIADHLKECPSCREEVQSLKDVRLDAGIPPAIWDTVSGKLAELNPEDQRFEYPMPIAADEGYPEEWSPPIAAYIPPPPDMGAEQQPPLAADEPVPPPARPKPPERPRGILARFLALFRMSPRHGAGPILALSKVNWGYDPTTKPAEHPRARGRVAFVILLQGFDIPPSEHIDSLYEALKPDEQAKILYDFVIPSRIDRALGPLGSSSAHPEEIGDALWSKLGVQRVVVITLISEKDRIKVRVESLDAKKGKPVGPAAEVVATESTLESVLKEAAYNSLGLLDRTTGP